jgi:DegV family protein with EDD domain
MIMGNTEPNREKGPGAIAVVTDSNSGITQQQSAALGLHVLPMPFTMDGEEYFEDINLTQEMFYEKLQNDAVIATSQPAPAAVTDLWDKLLKDYGEVIHMPMSSGLSASCHSAAALARDYPGKVHVIDNRRISVTLRQAAIDAVTLANAGKTGAEIKATLEKCSGESSIYIMVSTLRYLKQGGRITAAGAAIGTLLNIKPVLQIHGDKLDAYAKKRGTKQARAAIITAMIHDFENRFAAYASPDKMNLSVAYSYDEDAANDFKREAEEAFPGYGIHVDPLSLSVSCHIGPGALALACSKKISLT